MAEGDYVELVGRTTLKSKTHYAYRTRGCAAAVNSTGVPKVEDTLADPDIPDTAEAKTKCVSVQFDEVSEPGRVMIFAEWRRPITRAEAIA